MGTRSQHSRRPLSSNAQNNKKGSSTKASCEPIVHASKQRHITASGGLARVLRTSRDGTGNPNPEQPDRILARPGTAEHHRRIHVTAAESCRTMDTATQPASGSHPKVQVAWMNWAPALKVPRSVSCPTLENRSRPASAHRMPWPFCAGWLLSKPPDRKSCSPKEDDAGNLAGASACQSACNRTPSSASRHLLLEEQQSKSRANNPVVAVNHQTQKVLDLAAELLTEQASQEEDYVKKCVPELPGCAVQDPVESLQHRHKAVLPERGARRVEDFIWEKAARRRVFESEYVCDHDCEDDNDGTNLAEPDVQMGKAPAEAQHELDTKPNNEEEQMDGCAQGPSHAAKPVTGLEFCANTREQQRARSISLGTNPAPNPLIGIYRNNPDRLFASFQCVCSNGKISRNRVVWALKLVGHPSPELDWVRDIAEQTYAWRSAINYSEFVGFIELYEAQCQQLVRARFSQSEAEASGLITFAALSSLLRDLGITPLRWVVDDLLHEAASRAGADGRGFKEFSQLYGTIRDRAGFTLREAASLHTVFQRCDRDKDGFLDADGLRVAFRWLTSEIPENILPFLNGGGPDGAEGCSDAGLAAVSWSIPEDIFLAMMRICREHELRMVHAAFTSTAHSVTGHIGSDDLHPVAMQLGYVAASPQLVEEVAVACNFGGKPLLHEDLCKFFDKLRETRGFRRSELDQVMTAFEQNDVDRTGSIDHTELIGAVRWLGFPTTVENVLDAMEELYLGERGRIFFHEFLQLAGWYKDREVQSMRRAIETLFGGSSLPANKIRDVLSSLGYTLPLDPAHHQKASVLKSTDDTLSFWQVASEVAQHRAEVIELMPKNHGYTDAEVFRMRMQFQRCDSQKTGLLEAAELAAILKDLFTEGLALPSRTRTVLRNMCDGLRERYGFHDLLRFSRFIQDHGDRERAIKLRQVLATVKFSAQEVREFREIFRSRDTQRLGVLLYSQVREMLACLVPIRMDPDADPDSEPDDAESEFMSLLSEVDESKCGYLDFPDFLRAMRCLQDKDWENINESAAAMANGHQDKTLKRRSKRSVTWLDAILMQGSRADGQIHSRNRFLEKKKSL